jgi:hypothetical protein
VCGPPLACPPPTRCPVSFDTARCDPPHV